MLRREHARRPPDEKSVLSTCLVVLAVATLLVSCVCRSRSTPSKTGESDQTQYVPLPEHHLRRDQGDELEAELIRGAQETCREHAQKAISHLETTIVPVGQLMVAFRLLEDVPRYTGQRPVVLYGQTCRNLDGVPFVAVQWVNTNRETHRVLFLFRGSDKKLALLTVEIVREEKDFTTAYSRAWDLHPLSWEDFISLGSSDERDVFRVTVSDESPLPFPFQEGIQACVAVEDRTGAMSGFVPIGRPDYADRIEQFLRDDEAGSRQGEAG